MNTCKTDAIFKGKCSKRTFLKAVICVALSLTIFLQGAIDVFAITTKFDIPDIDKDWTPNNCIYKSPNLNIQVCKWGYGLVADVLNTSSIDALLAELHDNVSTKGNKRSILGIYMEGAGLSEANAADIANAGWTEVDLYYETFFVGGSAPTGAMTPFVVKTTHDNAMAILEEAGVTENIAMVSVSGVNMTWANYILYEPEFKFLKGKGLYSYKFIADLGVFVPVEETYFGAYGANFLELYDLQKAEADINGIYVTVTQSLPETIVVSADQVIVLRETAPVTPPTDDSSVKPSENEGEATPTDKTPSQEMQRPENDAEIQDSDHGESESQPSDENESVTESESAGGALVVANTDKTVEWKFANGREPENFTAEAMVKAISEKEVSVDFAYSGLLPEGTEVTVKIPYDNVNYQEEETLYLYYCNPETNQRDFVGEGKYQGSQVTFKIDHCSEYVITTIGPGGVENAGGSMPVWIIIGAFGVIACGVVGFVVFRKHRRSKTAV